MNKEKNINENKELLDAFLVKDYQDYADKVEELSFYPYHHKGDLFSLLYPTLGLIGEIGELFTIPDSDPEYELTFAKEMGDVCWYLFALANEIGLDLAKEIDTLDYTTDEPFVTMIEVSSRMSEDLKKAYRDNNAVLDSVLIEKYKTGIRKLICCVKLFAEEGLESNLLLVLSTNVAKLQSRKARGKLKGNGNDR